MSYLISISVGPVQDFIASARRSRDLWFGSWLLSELSKATATIIGKEKLIFPSIADVKDLEPNSDFNVANKILAIVPDIDKDFDETVRSAICKRLKEIYKPILDDLRENLNGFPDDYFKWKIAETQIKDMVELYWVAYPYDESKPETYQLAREKVESLLNARKSTRNFKQVNSSGSGKENAWGGNVPKSSLDGERESVIHEDAYGQRTEKLQQDFDAEGRRKLSAKQLREIFGVREGERLCGVGLLKRLGNRRNQDSFFSTSHVAAQPLLKKMETVKQEVIDKFVENLSNKLNIVKESAEFGRVPYESPYEPHPKFSRTIKGNKIGYDGHLLFAERLSQFLEGELKSKNKITKDNAKNKIRDAKKVLTDFLQETLQTPSPYYALLLADGDNMGKAIDRLTVPKEHQDFSEKLSKFARDTEQIVIKENKGSLVYAGGDDVLAFVPLHTVLDCARALADAFADTVIFTDKDGKEYKPTLSVGVCVAHHLEPLQDALAIVRKAEKEAKSVKGKNALAIIISKRSGADNLIKGSWADDRKTGKSFDERLKWFIYLHLADALPDGAAYELRRLWIKFTDISDPKKAVPSSFFELIKTEAVRILRRKRAESGTKEIADEVFEKLAGFINQSDLSDKDSSIKNLADEIISAREFANAYTQASDKNAIEMANDFYENYLKGVKTKK